MNKLPIALFALALLVALPVGAQASVSVSAKNPKIDYACLKTAVNARENTLKTAATTFGTTLAAAYADRATALGSAYDSGDSLKEIKDALKDAWKNFRADLKDARKDWRNSRKSAWKTFKTDVKSCKGASQASDAENVKEDVDM